MKTVLTLLGLLLGLTSWCGATSLSSLAAQMPPGTWADLTPSVNGFGGGALLDAPVNGHINEYADKGVWNPLTREAWYAGGAHCGGSSCTGTDKFIRYVDATNTWSAISARPATSGHSYQHNAIDPATGDLYYRNYNSKRVQRFRNGAWSDLPVIPAGNHQVAGALEAFPERGGLLFVDGDWGVWWYQFATATWVLLAETNGSQGTPLPKLRMGAYHNVAVYNPVHKIILFGGGNGSSTLYRIRQDGTLTTETTAPRDIAVNSTIFTVDPVSGEYLLFGNNAIFWKYSPATKAWTQLPASQNPPFFNTASDGRALGTVAFPISTYGIVMFTTWGGPSGSKVYLYKHAPGTSSSDTTAPTVSMTEPAANATVSGTVIVSANASDNVGVSGVQFKLDGANLGAEDTSAPYSVPWNTTTATQGAHTLTAVARDAAGNTKTATAVTVTVNNPTDTTPPSVAVTAPAAGTTVSGTVTVSANATDNVGVSGVQFKLNGANLGGEDTTVPYAVSWDTRTAANGTHSLTAVARDAAGNTRTAAALTVTVNNAGDTAAPTTPTNLIATAVSSSQINLTWTASTDNAGVAGYKVYRGGTQIGTSTLTSSSDSGLTPQTTYSYTVQAYDTAGNHSPQSASRAATTLSGGSSSDFSARCSAPGVLKCVGFDNASDIAGRWGNISGIFTGSIAPVLDATMKSSGASSLKFTIPSQSGAGASGSYFTNFTDTLSTLFGEGEEFYIQWRQRFSPEFLSTNYTGGGGWKQVIIGEGDRAGVCNPSNPTSATCPTSCTQLEIVAQNSGQRGLPQMYHSCGGKDGRYEPLEYWDTSLGNIVVQNAVGCLYGSGYPEPPCVRYKPNQWMTFQIHVRIGTWYKNDRNYHRDSTIQMWVADEGRSSKLVLDFSPGNGHGYDIANTKPPAEYGKVWLLPYHTGKDASQSHPTGYVWYDELIISRNKIADPGTGGSGPTPLAAPTNLTITGN